MLTSCVFVSCQANIKAAQHAYADATALEKEWKELAWVPKE